MKNTERRPVDNKLEDVSRRADIWRHTKNGIRSAD
jgi:hypothetical protein